MKILNLYAGIGGNRKHWGTEHQITAVEYDADIAHVYRDLWPDDELVVSDAHEYLRQHFQEFDFIWSSPPCPSHSKARFHIGVQHKGFEAIYPDMTLYEEILFLRHHFDGAWVVENVIPYYKPLIEATKIGRHLYWANFDIPPITEKAEGLRDKNKVSDMQELHGFDLTGYKLSNKRQVLRNVASPQIGKALLDLASAKSRV
jgi:DNA (cytosine-5)-methyltransferase 1